MDILNIEGLHLEVMPLRRGGRKLYRISFNSEVSVMLSQSMLMEIVTQAFMHALDRQFTHYIAFQDRDKDRSNFTMNLIADEDVVTIILKKLSPIDDNYIEHVFRYNKSDNKAINRFRNKLDFGFNRRVL